MLFPLHHNPFSTLQPQCHGASTITVSLDVLESNCFCLLLLFRDISTGYRSVSLPSKDPLKRPLD
jgi:hypothetical protein